MQNMTWHNMTIKRMQCNGKINYRDSGDGKVSTRVDTEQVSKIAKGEECDMREHKCKE